MTMDPQRSTKEVSDIVIGPSEEIANIITLLIIRPYRGQAFLGDSAGRCGSAWFKVKGWECC